MRAEDFDRATVEQLLARANQCFEVAQSPLEEPHPYRGGLAGGGAYPHLDDAGKLRLLLEAQFYLTAVARKRDERVAERDFKLEIWVIVLIGVEIVLSIAGLGVGIHEANQQARQFDRQVEHQNQQFQSQKTILDTQLDVLRNLLKSSQQSSDILNADERRRLAEAKAVPILKLTSNGADSLPSSLHGTGAGVGRRFDFVLRNRGTADATGIRIIVSGGFGIADIICNDGSFQVMPAPIGEAEQVGIRKRITIPDTLGKKVGKIGLSLTFISRPGLESPKGAPVHFEVLTDQHPVPMDLGSTTITLLV